MRPSLGTRVRRSGARPSLAVAAAVAALSFPACKQDRPLPPQAAAPSQGAPLPSPGAGGGSGPMDYQRRIAAGEQVVAKDPKNVQAWIQLGNDYFDTQQRQKAIEAYARALELDPNNPDVITDQGVMYRELGDYEKAVANFRRANEVNPQHHQSLFNLGVVYAYDLNQRDKAIEAWNLLIQRSPNSPSAAQARQAIQHLEQAPPAPAGQRR